MSLAARGVGGTRSIPARGPARGLYTPPPRYTAAPQPRPSAEAGLVVLASAFGARGDNATDNTEPFRAALAKAAELGGATVAVAGGIFRVEGNLTIPPGVTFAGTFNVVPSHDTRNGQPINDGTVLVPTGGRGIPCDLDCTSAFITVAANGLLRGLVILYDEQERVQTPVPYPWAVFLGDPNKLYGGRADNAAVTDVELLGAWNGVAAIAAHRHYIARVQGQPLNIGVFVDETYDIGRIEDVHFNPWFSSQKPFVYYQTNYGRAFVMGRSDWEYVFNTFAFAYNIGYHFIERATGSMNGNFLGIGADLMTNASVYVEQSQPMGNLITNGEFTAFCDAPHFTFCDGGKDAKTPKSPMHLRVAPGNAGAVKFVNTAFWGPAAQIAQTQGTGTVTFSQCHMDAWDNHVTKNGTFARQGSAAISQLGGNLIVSECDFTGGRGKAGLTTVELELGMNASKTIFSSNMVSGTLNVDRTKASRLAKIVIKDNLDDSPM